MKIFVLSKRRYMSHDLLEDRYGRFWEIPYFLSKSGHQVYGLALGYRSESQLIIEEENLYWYSTSIQKDFKKFMQKASYNACQAEVIWACSDAPYGIWGLSLARHYDIPLVFDLYDNFEAYAFASLPGFKQWYRHAVREANLVTCVSQPLADLVYQYGRKKPTLVLENACQINTFKPMNRAACRDALGLPKEAVLIGTAASLSRKRGIHHVIEAFLQLTKNDSNMYLILAGAKQMPLPKDNRILYLGMLPLEGVAQLYNALDVVIISNKDDNFGRYCFPQKAYEIMSCDRPLVAANVGSMSLLFKDHPQWLYQANDANDLVRAIRERLIDQTTNYACAATWQDRANSLLKFINTYSGEDFE